MIFKNCTFEYQGRLLRLLHLEDNANKAWVINLNEVGLLTSYVRWSDIKDLSPFDPDAKSESKDGTRPKTLVVTEAMTATKKNAIQALGNLITQIPAIFDPDLRGPLVLAQAQSSGFSIPTIYKHLRRYFAGGQTESALLARFNHCGRKDSQESSGRGARANNGRKTYLLTSYDFKAMRDVIDTVYLKESSKSSLKATFQELLERHYAFFDGNQTRFLKEEGERPTPRQFNYFLNQNYSTKTILKKRKGAKDFALQDREVTGTTLADCLGVGHYYEADATIGDVYLTSGDDVNKIVGKPTIYIIIDRKSRLIVGWYVGLEQPSWQCAVQAIVSIAQDKQALCMRLGVEYKESDWPAHQMYPKEFLADRGEMLNHQSAKLSSELDCSVTFVPARRADWKPIVESNFKQIRVVLQDDIPGMDPPENAKRRQGKHYEKDACLTLQDFERTLLNGIILHNRRPMLEDELNLEELNEGISPIPLDLWNHGIVSRAGVLSRYAEEKVCLALMPRDSASVDEHGIFVNNCYYTCEEALKDEWFVTGRKKNFKVSVSYDKRLVDSLFVHDPFRKGNYYQCKLTARSTKYVGLSVAEVKWYANVEKAVRGSLEQYKLQIRSDYNAAVRPTVDAAKKRLKDAGLTAARSARKADTKAARAQDLAKERQDIASVKPSDKASSKSKVVQLPRAPKASGGNAHSGNEAGETTAQSASTSANTEPKVQKSLAQMMADRIAKLESAYSDE